MAEELQPKTLSETVKAYASRMTDIARRAYDRFCRTLLKRSPRAIINTMA